MTQEDRYAVESHGVFPRFVLAAILITALELAPDLYIRATGSYALPGSTTESALVAFNIILVPFGIFVLFYLAARVRVNLSVDYTKVALSIFLGSVLALAVLSLPDYVSINAGSFIFAYQSDPLTTLLSWAGSSVFASVEYTLIGFSAVLLSYYRRM